MNAIGTDFAFLRAVQSGKSKLMRFFEYAGDFLPSVGAPEDIRKNQKENIVLKNGNKSRIFFKFIY